MEPRQYEIIRDEHTRMKESLVTVRQYLKNKNRKHYPETEVEAISKSLDFLDQVLEFSATWNGVETKEFFPESSPIQTYLQTHGMLRLGVFFSKPFVQVSKELRGMGAEYPLLLKKLYEAYYLRTLRRKSASYKALHVS